MRQALFVILIATAPMMVFGQTGTEFWMAPPDVTYWHNAPGDAPIYFNVTAGNVAATVTISQPSNAAFNGGAPIVLNVAANSAVRYNMTALKTQLETRPTNTICNTGLHIVSTADITCYYESSNTNNPDILALKGANGLGTEFYIPLHKYAPFHNHNFGQTTDLAFASFDIVATQNNTTVLINPPVAVDGHPAQTPFVITLNQGQTYSCANTNLTNYTDPSTHPSGAAVLSDKPIAISIKDDSNHNPSGGCYDLMMDQIVPVNILGTEYVAVKGALNATGDESLFLMAVENNTQVFIDGGSTPVATLFAGQYYRHDMDYLIGPNNATYVTATKPLYAIHVTGFGCEMGMAILPPLNCAGSQQVGFTRSTNEGFFLNLLVRNGSQNNFVVTGTGTATIPGSAFQTVPGTGGEWMAARIQYNTTQVPVNQAIVVNNTTDVFSLGIINGGAGSGCRYGFFSEFSGEILINAGVDQTSCAGDTVELAGTISGGSTTGIWTTTGSGTFQPDATSLTATYEPSVGDLALGNVTLTLTSTGHCTPVSDDMIVTFPPRPIPDAGTDQQVCRNNPVIALSGTVLNAAGGVWSGGAGTFLPSTSDLNANYTPTASEITAGSLWIYLTTIGNGVCAAVKDSTLVTFTPSPVPNAGLDRVLCANNGAVTLNGSFTGATGGIWSGGIGTFDPSTTNLNAIYTPTIAEIASGSMTLTLTTTGNGNCNAVADPVLLSFTTAPTADAGINSSACANNANVALNGVVTVATGGVWTGGTGAFTPDNSTLNATYAPTSGEIAAGTVTLVLTTSGNGTCSSVSGSRTITFTPAPVVDAGSDGTVCANTPAIPLAGIVTGASGGVWSGGNGTYSPNNITLSATYTPSAAEITAGGVDLTLTSAGNGTCSPVTDQVHYTITPAPTVNVGLDQVLCGNNATATLNAAITVATGVQWSGGTGLYLPGSTAQNITYSPSPIEVTNGSVILTAATTGNGTCAATSDAVLLTFTSAPIANAGIDQSVSSNNPATTLAGSHTVASGIIWSGGAGTYSPNNTTQTAIYTPTAAEIGAGSVTLTLTTTGNGTCTATSDDMIISFSAAPTANAGIDQVVCGNNASVALTGAVTIATGGIWSGGGGSYNPNNTSLITTYTPSAAEIAAGSATLTLTTAGNGNSAPVSDQMVVTISATPVVNAGPNLAVCANQATAQLVGVVNHATGGVWSGGSGTFDPSTTNLNATYAPTLGEIATGHVTLTLTSTGNGTCNAVSDQVVIGIAPAPVVNAGIDRTVCSNNANVQMAGTVSNATGGSWSGGTGTFSPSINTLNAVYSPSTSELANGSVTLTLTSRGNGTCLPVSDVMTIYFSQSPVVNAGTDRTVCANDPTLVLNGSVSISGGGVWSGGGGSFTPDANTLNATYHPSPAEVALGTATLTLTSTQNGLCNAASDQMTIAILASPTANAGANLMACSNNAQVQLGGSVSGAGGGQWSGGAGTYTPSVASLNAVYVPTVAEIAAGTLTLTLTTIGNGSCVPVSDQVLITFTAPPTANAGGDGVRCANNAGIQLNGQVTIASGGAWSGAGGSFSPNATALNAVYMPSQGEITAGSATLVLTTVGNNGCVAVTDDVTYTFTPAPTAAAGVDMTTCANNAAVQFGGAVVGAVGGAWSGGAGTFTPNVGDLNATYAPTVAEIAAGQVTLVLTTMGNGNCNAVRDSMLIVVNPLPVVNAGPDQQVCANNPGFQLNGFVGNAPGGLWSGGAGNYFPNTASLAVQYTPTAAEIAAGSITFTLTSTGTTICAPVSDQVTIVFTGAPVVDAGIDLAVCANNGTVQLSGDVINANGGIWTGGSGTYAPSNHVFTPVYTPTAAEIIAGSMNLFLTSAGNGNCFPVRDTIHIIFTPAPTVGAGTDQDVCANNPLVVLNGGVTIATGGHWSGGLGSYTPDANTLGASYSPTAFELQSGQIELTLTTTGNGNCLAVTDQISFTVTPSPTVDAGPNVTTCSSALQIQLAGIIQGGATTGTWSTSGTGSFYPGPAGLNAVYTASALDSLNGSVVLTLTSTNNGLCNAVSDAMTVTILPNATANAGPDQEICASASFVQLAGTINGNATQGVWTSTGSGTFTPSASTANAIYQLAAGDSTLGSIVFTWSVNSCDNAMDQMTATITPISNAFAGVDQVTCYSDLTSVINGSTSGASTTGSWTTLGSGTFMNPATALSNIYQASAQDSLNMGVDLVLTANNTGACPVDADTMHISIFPVGTVNAGPDLSFCANNATVQLAGTLNGDANQLQWTTSGTGSFYPNNTVLTPTYIPSNIDTAIGTLTLSLSALNSCNNANDGMTLVLTPAPYVNAGPDQTYCDQVTVFTLNGMISGVTNVGQWSTTGTGTIANAGALSTTYTASAGDIAAGHITLELRSLNNAGCSPVMDAVTIWLTDGIIASAGPDQTVCVMSDHANLQGTVLNGSSSGTWTTSGTGTFSPNADVLNAAYYFSPADVANGSVSLHFMATNTGTCPADQDQMTITFGNASYAFAGADQELCSNAPIAQLAGNFSGGAQGIVWTTSGTGTFSNNTDPNATYSMSNTDITAGTVELTLTTITNGSCAVSSDATTISAHLQPNINAGSDLIACTSAPIQLAANAVHAPGGTWTTTGTGTFFDPNALITLYYPSASDSISGSVILTVTTTGVLTCSAASNQLQITFGGGNGAMAGTDVITCSSDPEIALNGAVTGTSTGQWTTSGTGSFLPAADVLNATYVPSAVDFMIGDINLTLTTTNNGGCPAGQDTLMVSYQLAPVADAGPDVSTCDATAGVQLSGTISGAAGGKWTTSGSGTFLPDNIAPDAIYQPSIADSLQQQVMLVLTTTGNAICDAASDTLILSFVNPLHPAFSVGDACAGSSTVFTDASTTDGSPIIGWNWAFGNGTNGSGLQTNASFETAGEYVVTLSIFAQNGCSATSSQSVEVMNTPVAAFSVNGELFTEEVLVFNDQSVGAGSWQYDFGDGTGSTMQAPSHVYSMGGQYTVVQTVANAAGCSDSFILLLPITKNMAVPPQLPDAFSPNGDGVNDIFYARGGPFETMQLTVYNGWGEMIFTTSDPGSGWDGTHNGTPEINGVYVYSVIATSMDGKYYDHAGKVTLIR